MPLKIKMGEQFTYTFNTGLYTKNAYLILREFLRRNSILPIEKKPRQICHEYHEFDSQFKYWYVCNTFINELYHNYVKINPDGEISFSYTIYNADYDERFNIDKIELADQLITFQSFILSNESSTSFLTTTELIEIPKIFDGIGLIVRYLKGTLLEKDKHGWLYDKFIGHPLDPFLSEVLQNTIEEYKNAKFSYSKDWGKIMESFFANSLSFDLDVNKMELAEQMTNKFVAEEMTKSFNKIMNCLR